jgi:4,5-DOPA dioxygenase extradiol
MASSAILGLSSLRWLIDQPETPTMPVLFIGHGSPMNALEDNIFTRSWKELSGKVARPSAILVISAHWLTKGSFITAVDKPATIHDFGGFPQALFDVQYPAPGLPGLAQETAALFPENMVHLDDEWGLDHGTWSVLKHMYPLADVPVLQLSIDYHQPPAYHFEMAQYLQKLRKRGVLIVGSGNIVHNLGKVAWDKMGEADFAYDWARESNELLKQKILSRDFKALIDYKNLGTSTQLAIPTPDHYYPLLYALGLAQPNEELTLFNDYAVAGSLTMTSVGIGL